MTLSYTRLIWLGRTRNSHQQYSFGLLIVGQALSEAHGYCKLTGPLATIIPLQALSVDEMTTQQMSGGQFGNGCNRPSPAVINLKWATSQAAIRIGLELRKKVVRRGRAGQRGTTSTTWILILMVAGVGWRGDEHASSPMRRGMMHLTLESSILWWIFSMRKRS